MPRKKKIPPRFHLTVPHSPDLKQFLSDLRRIGLRHYRAAYPRGPKKKGGRPSLRQQVIAVCEMKWPHGIPARSTLGSLVEAVRSELGPKPNGKLWNATTVSTHIIQWFLRTKTLDEVPKSWLRCLGTKGAPRQFGIWQYQFDALVQRLLKNPQEQSGYFERLRADEHNPRIPKPQRDIRKSVTDKFQAFLSAQLPRS